MTMKSIKMLGVAALFGTLFAAASIKAAAPAPAVGPSTVITVGHVKAVHGLLAAMQAEKLMRTTASLSQYANEAQRAAVFAKLDKVPKEQIYARLAYPLAKFISAETANEMARFYTTPQGQQVVYKMYNSSGGMQGMGMGEPKMSAAEKKELKRPEYVKAKKELDEADSAIHHEAFVLLQAISKK
jgi:hypothetical protein